MGDRRRRYRYKEKISLVEKMDSGEVRSVEITFNSNKLMVSDEDYESNVAIALEMKEGDK